MRELTMAFGVICLVAAAAFPAASVLSGLDGAGHERVLAGVWITRAALAVLGLSMVALFFSPRGTFGSSGLDDAVSGLRLRTDDETDRRAALAVLLLTVLAAALRFVHVNSDLWLDEIASVVEYMRLDGWATLYTYPAPNQQLLNTFLGSQCIGLFGEDAWSVRLPALVFGIATVPALYYLARAFTSRREALLSTALLAVSYHHVWFSQNARGYSGMVFWSVLGSALFLRGLAFDRARHWVGYVIAMTFGVFNLLNTAFVLASHVPAYAILRWRRSRVTGPGARDEGALTRRLLAATAFVGLGIVLTHGLAFPAMFETFQMQKPQHGWTDPIQFVGVVVSGLMRAFGAVGLGAIIIGGAVVAVGWFSYWRQSPLVNALLVLPAIFNVIALVVLKFGAYPRSFLYMLPIVILLAVRGLTVIADRIEARWCGRDSAPDAAPKAGSASRTGRLAIALGVLTVVASAYTVTRNYRHPKQDYRGALAFVRASMERNDTVGAVGWAGIGYRNYYDPSMPFLTSRDDLVSLRRMYRRVWILYSFTRDMRRFYPEIHDYLQQEFDFVRVFPGTLSDGHIFVVRAEGR